MSYFHFPANQNLLSRLRTRYFCLLLFSPYTPSPAIGERGQRAAYWIGQPPYGEDWKPMAATQFLGGGGVGGGAKGE